MTSFYQPLQSAKSIRLLHVEPDVYSRPVVCSLEEVSLDRRPKYEALSYTWGPQNPSQNIWFEGQRKPVGPNLFSAIRALRYEHIKRTLWVDAICINQDSAEEKNHQIRLMPSIYQTSVHVQIWLGEADISTNQAFQCLRKLLNFFKELGYSFNLATVRDNDPKLKAVRIAVSKKYSTLGLSAPDWAALNTLVRRPWFSRVWVIQEAVYARQATFVCGTCEIPWEAFKDALEGIASLGLLDYLTVHGIKGLSTNVLRMVNRMRLKMTNPAYPKFYDILTLTRETQATDPRDKIFALVGLARDLDAHDRQITPDYHKADAVTVFTDFVVYYLRRPEFFRVLQLIPDTPPTNTVPNLPSWVPDFSQNTTRQPFEAGMYHAAGYTVSTPRVSADHQKLFLYGRVLDTVIALCPSDSELRNDMPWDTPESYRRSTIHSIALRYQGCYYLAINNPPSTSAYGNPAGFHEAYWRTLLCDRDEQALRPTAEYERSFNAYHNIWYRPVEEILNPASLSDGLLQQSRLFEKAFSNWAGARRFCATKGKRLAWAPQTCQVDDVISVFEGAEVPFVMRPRADGSFQLIGECYIHGFMYGEGMKAGASIRIEFTIS